MNEMIKGWEKNFYAELLVFTLLFIALFISLKKKNLFPKLKFLPVYFSSFISLMLIHYIWDIFFYGRSQNQNFQSIDTANNYVVGLIELLAFSYYFYFISYTKKLKKTIAFVGLLTLLFFLVNFFYLLFFTEFSNITALHNFYIAESTILLLCCITYFVNLLKIQPLPKLSTSPHFWVSAGLLLYLIGTFPITILTDYFIHTNIRLYENTFAIVHVFYSFLFLLILRAYLCRPGKQIQMKK